MDERDRKGLLIDSGKSRRAEPSRAGPSRGAARVPGGVLRFAFICVCFFFSFRPTFLMGFGVSIDSIALLVCISAPVFYSIALKYVAKAVLVVGGGG